jgi:hypothetical protein
MPEYCTFTVTPADRGGNVAIKVSLAQSGQAQPANNFQYISTWSDNKPTRLVNIGDTRSESRLSY